MSKGDQDDVTYTDAQGVRWCSPHYNGEKDGVDRGRSIVYQDVVRVSQFQTSCGFLWSQPLMKSDTAYGYIF